MKPALFAVALAAFSSFAFADNDTAYTALRVYGKKFGEQSLNRVLELRGRSGGPQPAVWKIVAADSSSRGGVREVEVQRGKIISERTPINRTGNLSPMNFNQLNLDSDGAFTIANQEMEKRRLPFDRLDYALRNPGGSTPPVWFLELFEGASGRVATLELAADSGAILNQQRLTNGTQPPDYSSDRDFVRRRPDGDQGQHWSRPGEHMRGVEDFFHRLGKRMERRGEQLKNFFTGEEDEPRR
jgi:hypothetical protein